MKLELTSVEENASDYIVTLKGPSGKKIRILVSKEDSADYFSFVWESSTPIGLNLVTSSHYV